MSMMYCAIHHRYWDSDQREDCLSCEWAERELLRQSPIDHQASDHLTCASGQEQSLTQYRDIHDG